MGAFVYFEEEPGQTLKLAVVVVLTVLINVVYAAQGAETVNGSKALRHSAAPNRKPRDHSSLMFAS